MDEDYVMPPDPCEVDWRIGAKGRAWESGEAMPRYHLTPEKAELIDGKIYGSDADRLRMLGLLLENCGAEAAARLGDPNVWRKSVAALDDQKKTPLYAVQTALRRYDDLSDYDAKGAVRFWEQTASIDFMQYDTPGENGTPSATRDTLLDYWRTRSAKTASFDNDDVSSKIDRVVSNEADTEAKVWVKQTTEQTRWEAVSANERRRPPQTTVAGRVAQRRRQVAMEKPTLHGTFRRLKPLYQA